MYIPADLELSVHSHLLLLQCTILNACTITVKGRMPIQMRLLSRQLSQYFIRIFHRSKYHPLRKSYPSKCSIQCCMTFCIGRRLQPEDIEGQKPKLFCKMFRPFLSFLVPLGTHASADKQESASCVGALNRSGHLGRAKIGHPIDSSSIFAWLTSFRALSVVIREQRVVNGHPEETRRPGKPF